MHKDTWCTRHWCGLFYEFFRIPGERRNVQSAETSAETNQGPEAGSAKPQKDRPVAGVDSKGDRQRDLP